MFLLIFLGLSMHSLPPPHPQTHLQRDRLCAKHWMGVCLHNA